ncbi:MAG: UDP-N-acetylmuramoyl-L-alanyl-D-glutamate--2,6-diaminopimelate ligase [Actinobacteria bacterium]|nr:UDP-N-acetylmuramoyl-L-alanyl-D-glutamate--2,6-diaminopimelate ligase [Actinomycetota bacterium]
MSSRPVKFDKKALSSFDQKLFNTDVEVSGVSINAAEVKSGDLFIALPGAKTHGINFIDEAISNGAVAVLSDRKIDCSIPVFIDQTPRNLVGPISDWLYNNPFSQLVAAGITGTNGKTTTTNLVKQFWDLNGIHSGLIGTLGVEIGVEKIAGVRTTPEADELQALAAVMVERGSTHLAMEVSSIAIDQSRVSGAKYKVVAFSNLTQDHLDYHKSMDEYFNAKAKLFTSEYAQNTLINIDNSYGKKLFEICKITKKSVSRNDKNADWHYSKIESQSDGYKVEISDKNGKVISGNFPLIGEHNLDNLLLAIAVVSICGLTNTQISNAINKLKSVPGRLEIISAGQPFSAIVDYAHTPDAVSRVLNSVKSFTSGRVIGILGCGGDRDKSKRSPMGQALFAGSELAIFTSDNPRSEKAEEILKDMTGGINLGEKGFVLTDRKDAINFAVKMAKSGDCILLLGKGHESGQEINGVVTPFDDRVELLSSIRQAAK